MTKQLLAKQLRKRLRKSGLVSIKEINSCTDDEIIDSYNTCACCGDKFLSETQLTEAIQRAENAEHFIEISETMEYLNANFVKN